MIRILSLCIIVAVSSASDIDFGLGEHHNPWANRILKTTVKNIEEYFNMLKSGTQAIFQTLKNTEFERLNKSILNAQYIHKNITALKNKMKSVETCLQSSQLQINAINRTSHREIEKCFDKPYDLFEKNSDNYIEEIRSQAVYEMTARFHAMYPYCFKEKDHLDLSSCLDNKLLNVQKLMEKDLEKIQQKELGPSFSDVLLQVITHDCLAKIDNHLNFIFDAARILANDCVL